MGYNCKLCISVRAFYEYAEQTFNSCQLVSLSLFSSLIWFVPRCETQSWALRNIWLKYLKYATFAASTYYFHMCLINISMRTLYTQCKTPKSIVQERYILINETLYFKSSVSLLCCARQQPLFNMCAQTCRHVFFSPSKTDHISTGVVGARVGIEVQLRASMQPLFHSIYLP